MLFGNIKKKKLLIFKACVQDDKPLFELLCELGVSGGLFDAGRGVIRELIRPDVV